MNNEEIENKESGLTEDDYYSLSNIDKDHYWYNYFSQQIRGFVEIAGGQPSDAICRDIYIEAKRVDSRASYCLAEVISDHKLKKLKILSKGILLPVFYSLFI